MRVDQRGYLERDSVSAFAQIDGCSREQSEHDERPVKESGWDTVVASPTATAEVDFLMYTNAISSLW
jgi:hypothetical protein